MARSKYSFEDIQQWAKSYEYHGNFADVAREFGINRSVIRRNILKNQEALNFKTQDEVDLELFKQGLRKCYGCKEIKPLDCFHKCRKDRFGTLYKCIECRSTGNTPQIYSEDDVMKWYEYYKQIWSTVKVGKKFNVPKTTVNRLFHKYDLERLEDIQNRLFKYNQRLCVKCNEIKIIDKFWWRRDSQKYRNLCKDCPHTEDAAKRKVRVEKRAEYFAENKDRILAERKKRKKEYHKQWREDNREQLRDYTRKNLKKHRFENPEKYKEYARRRRARKSGVDERYLQEDWEITLSVFGERCFKCKNNHSDLTKDHHKSLSSGGALAVDNAVPLCRSCNSQKHNRDPEDFYSEEEINTIEKLFKKAKEIKTGAQ